MKQNISFPQSALFHKSVRKLKWAYYALCFGTLLSTASARSAFSQIDGFNFGIDFLNL